MNLFYLLFLIILLSFSNCSKPVLEVKVTDFGAIPNDGKDDAPSILSAIKSIKDSKNTSLVFTKGNYDIFSNPDDKGGRHKPSLEFKNLSDLTIKGNGSEFIGHDYSTLFTFTDCNNLTIQDLTIDWDPLPFTQGKVVGLDSNYIDIEVVAPFTAQAGLRTEGLLGYDPDNHRMARTYTDHNQKGFEKTSEVIQPGIMRLFIGRQDRFAGILPLPGKNIIDRHQIYGCQGIQLVNCNKVKAENINIYSNPGMGLTGNFCRDISLRHFNVMIRPGSGRWMSSTADATHFIGCRGTLIMENCLFEGMGDDATNVNSGRYMLVAERLNNNTLRIISGQGASGNISTPPEAGDKLELSAEDLVPYTIAEVKSALFDEKEKALIVEFSRPLPERTVKGDIIANASACPSVRIRNCTVIRNRARGFIIKTRDVVIEDCIFEDVSSAAIVMEADIVTWWESIGSHDIVIRNNRFINCRYERSFISGIIECYSNSNTIRPGVHQRISIENNKILGSGKNAIKIGSADGVNITANIIDKPNEDAIIVHHSRNVSISGNKLTNKTLGLTIGEGCEENTIRVENNMGF